MIKKELLKLAERPDFLDLYSEGMSALYRSGIFDIMRLLGQPELVHEGKDVNSMAAQAAKAVGWNAAINTLLNFEDILIQLKTPSKSPSVQFDGLALAVAKGDLLEGEADAIRNGRKPDPSVYKPIPTRTNGS